MMKTKIVCSMRGENGIGGWTLAVTQQGTTDTTVYDAVDFPTGLFSIFAAPERTTSS
ncbi:MAG: hypothetical protein R2788_05630 [Saprospiraceae bacterium]